MIEAYFDESGSHEGAPILCIGGYLFERDKCIEFDAAWREMLSDFQLPFFHMAACEAGEKPFDTTPVELRTAIVKRASKTINKSMTYGLAIAVNESDYNRIMPRHPLIGSAYSFIAKHAFNAVRVWADRVNYYGPVSYFFESGHAHQAEADRIMHEHAQAPAVALGARYASHSFLKKQDSPALQAADLLAWHFSDNWARNLRGELSRDSFVSLISDAPPEDYWQGVWNKREIRRLAKKVKKLDRKYPDAAREIFENEIF